MPWALGCAYDEDLDRLCVGKPARCLEEQIDDVLGAIEATGAARPPLISIVVGCALAVLFAAAHPNLRGPWR